MGQVTCTYCNDTGHRLTRNFGTDEDHRIRCHCRFELPLKFVIQPYKMGCGIAALAMVSGKTFEEVRVLMDLSHDWCKGGRGMTMYEVEQMLEPLGFSYQSRRLCQSRLGGTERKEWPGKPFAPLHIALVQNLPNTGGHFVVWLEDGRVMDPWWGVIPNIGNYSMVMEVTGIWKIPMGESLDKLEHEIIQWGAKTFPKAGASSRAAHLLKEARELKKAPDDPSEMADIFHLLVQQGQGKLAEFVRKKFEENKKREWGKPDKDGVVQHVKPRKKK